MRACGVRACVRAGWSVNVGDIRYPNHPRVKSVKAAGRLVLNLTESAAHRAISAQTFVSGGVMGWYGGSVNWENWLGLSDDDIAYTRLLASTKVAAAKFLTFGRLWRQPEWRIAVPIMRLHDYGCVVMSLPTHHSVTLHAMPCPPQVHGARLESIVSDAQGSGGVLAG